MKHRKDAFRRRVGLVSVLAAGLLLVLGAGTAAAAAPPSTYVSLGDSLAFGYQPNLVNAGDFNPADYVGYAEDYAAMHPGMTLANFGCPSETTTSFIQGGCPWPVAALHMPHSGSQLSAAVSYLGAHPQTSLITIDLGSNDLLDMIEGCNADLACIESDLPATLTTMLTNYGQILGTLKAAALQAKLVVFNLYNPLALALPATDQLLATINAKLAGLAARFGATVADAYGAINGKAGSPSERAHICSRTWECTPLASVHPNKLGYKQLSIALLHAVGH